MARALQNLGGSSPRGELVEADRVIQTGLVHSLVCEGKVVVGADLVALGKENG